MNNVVGRRFVGRAFSAVFLMVFASASVVVSADETERIIVIGTTPVRQDDLERARFSGAYPERRRRRTRARRKPRRLGPPQSLLRRRPRQLGARKSATGGSVLPRLRRIAVARIADGPGGVPERRALERAFGRHRELGPGADERHRRHEPAERFQPPLRVERLGRRARARDEERFYPSGACGRESRAVRTSASSAISRAAATTASSPGTSTHNASTKAGWRDLSNSWAENLYTSLRLALAAGVAGPELSPRQIRPYRQRTVAGRIAR